MKTDMTRDYYADLELPPTTDVTEIKRQFRKLALKYHPDRNPGREAEVNSKFQTIQSAHEVLTNPEQKAKYDAYRNRTRYPAASGVKGNPWQDAANNFPPPPKRPPMPTRPSAAARYTSWANPPPQKSTREDPNMAERMRAWDRMRPGSSSRQNNHPTAASGSTSNSGTRRTTRPMDPPPPPPRTEAQRKKAEASFGTRRTNFTQPVPDEPPAASSNYSTTKQRTNLFSQAAEAAKQTDTESDYIDPLSRQFQETFVDGRQRTPYSVHSGEKFNPFDGTNINRRSTVRDNLRNSPNAGGSNQPPSPPRRRRSASVPDDADLSRPSARSPFSRAGNKYTPDQPSPDSHNASSQDTSASGSGSSPANGGNGPTVYDSPCSFSAFSSSLPYQTVHPKKLAQMYSNSHANEGKMGRLYPTLSSDVQGFLAEVYPSGSAQASRGSPESFEAKQQRQLQELLNYKTMSYAAANSFSESAFEKQYPTSKYTDNSRTSSFGFSIDDDTFKTTSEQQRFMRKSADSINTRFVADDFSGSDWKFNAGGGAEEDPFLAAKKRAQKEMRRGRQSPKKNGSNFAQQTATSDSQPRSAEPAQGGFNAEQWTEKIGPEAFVPQSQPPRGLSTSPTKFNRPIKKPRAVRMTAGTAGLVDEDETSSSEDKTRPGTAMGATDGTTPAATEDTVAMDIDTPPPEPEKTATEAKGARNIPVEPTKPEWRAGNVAGAGPAETNASSDPNRMGSEDSSDFLFSDFKNVAPFAPQPGGLGSLSDLKSSLPFESKAAPRLAVEKESAKPLTFPAPPKSPRPPTVLAVSSLKPGHETWAKYVQDFHRYMEEWADFNGRVTDHFATRKNLINESKKATGFSWIEARGDAGIRKYLQWCEEDKIVRQKWMAACEAHELRVKEFLKYREKMLQ